MKRWYDAIAKRPAVQKGYKVPKYGPIRCRRRCLNSWRVTSRKGNTPTTE